MVKVFVVAPAGIVTVAGTLAAANESLSDTRTPPIGAGDGSVRRPMTLLQPATVY
jgi:hypothetical protein